MHSLVINTTPEEVKATYYQFRNKYRELQKKIRLENLDTQQLQGLDKDIYEYWSFLRPYVHSEDGDVML